METSAVTVQAHVQAPIEKVWELWTEPEHITRWNAASDDWESPSAQNDVRVGGSFTTRMQAKDGSAGFDFGGTYTAVEKPSRLEYRMSDGRMVEVAFAEKDGGTLVTETFDVERENPAEMQRAGWQAILDNFKKYAEQRSAQ